MPIIGLTKGKRGTDSLFHINKNAYIKVSLIGVVIAVLSIAICIAMKKIIRHMECEIKSLPSYTAPVVKYKLFKSRYTVVFCIEGKSHEYKFEAVKVKKVYDFKNGSFVRYKIYKGEVIPVTFYLASPETKGRSFCPLRILCLSLKITLKI
jgi:hypothetical protein